MKISKAESMSSFIWRRCSGVEDCRECGFCWIFMTLDPKDSTFFSKAAVSATSLEHDSTRAISPFHSPSLSSMPRILVVEDFFKRARKSKSVDKLVEKNSA